MFIILITVHLAIALISSPSREENFWLSLARVLNVTSFCLEQDHHHHYMLGNCLRPVCKPAKDIKEMTFLANFPDKTISYDDLANWGKSSYTLPVNYLQLYTPKTIITPNDTCVNFINCTTQCKSIPGTLLCNTTQNYPSVKGYVTLPTGWFFTCNSYTYNYIPANVTTNTKCCLSRISVFLPTQDSIVQLKHNSSRTRRSIPVDQKTCNNQITFLSEAEGAAMIASVISTLFFGPINQRQLQHLGCNMAKALNQTSQALALLNNEQHNLRQAILDNRAAIDYLLLFHHQGCKKIKGMCCFNLTDNSQEIQDKIDKLKQLMQKIKQNKEE
nr:uncharacterized protein LOC105706794 isoform X2 [Aotus nancymaae]XP_021528215.1 uncharacterized protein LOC105706794 isoform X2 [Aotus nancymaae]XP_021528216.1 uncharacterized protein LOC105706794 isoform X2 [Aotus nancymaae]